MKTIAIIGKPNVGKSTLFNRIIKKNKSIVSDIAGTTRDRGYEQAQWLNQQFILIDTGGIKQKNNSFQENITKQAMFAINEADEIIFLVAGKEGLNSDDYFIAKLLKKHKANNIKLVINKIENNFQLDNEDQYYNLGFGKPFKISASHGIGIGDLLDSIIKDVNKDLQQASNNELCFCIIGKPNVGKSSLVNSILNQERVIVSQNSGTTTDAIDTIFKKDKQLFKIIDTAGIKRKSKMDNEIEKYAFLRTEKAIKRSNIVILMLDGSDDFTQQDEVIAGLIHKANIPSIIVVNKWDLVAKDSFTMNKMTKIIKDKFKFLTWSPIIFISALKKIRINAIFDEIKKIVINLNKKIASSMLTHVILKAQMMNNAPSFKNGRIKINYVVQVEGQIPTFVLFCNNPNYLHFSYARYLENCIREAFDFNNIPITLYFKAKHSKIRKHDHDEKNN